MGISEDHKRYKEGLLQRRRLEKLTQNALKLVNGWDPIQDVLREQRIEWCISYYDDGESVCESYPRKDRWCHEYHCDCSSNCYSQTDIVCEAYRRRSLRDKESEEALQANFLNKFMLKKVAIFEYNYECDVLIVDPKKGLGTYVKYHRWDDYDIDNWQDCKDIKLISKMIPFSRLIMTFESEEQKCVGCILQYYMTRTASQKKDWKTRHMSHSCLRSIMKIQARFRGALFRHKILYNTDTEIGGKYIYKKLGFDQPVQNII